MTFWRSNYRPRSVEVDVAVDFLVWHGLLSWTRSEEQSSLEITDIGEAAVTSICSTGYVKRLRNLSDDLNAALAGLGAVPLRRVCDLIFEEPGFEQSLRDSPGGTVALSDGTDPMDYPSARIQAAARYAVLRHDERTPAESRSRLVLLAYLKFLAIRAERDTKSANAGTGVNADRL
jgi:hypothetical protein